MGNAIYTATFSESINKYTIRFINYDGSELQKSELEYGEMPVYVGEEPIKPATAEFTYTFIGWSPDIVAVTEDTTYTAQFSDSFQVYVITWKNYDGSVLATSNVIYGEIPVYSGEEPMRESTAEFTYTFSGWTPIIVAVASDATYIATFTETINKYTIKFVNYDGAELQSGELEYGKTPAYTGVTPTRAKTAQFTYIFSGWTPSIVDVVGNAIYTATFSESTNKYTIKFVNYDGTELQSSQIEYGKMPVYTGEEPIKPATAEFTYTFIGWSPNIKAVIEDTTYTAQFSDSSQLYVITWKNYDGSILATSNVEYGEMPVYSGAEPTREATAKFTYTFSGWTPSIVIVDGNATYTAIFAESINKYTITFYSEDGNIELGVTTVNYGETATYMGTMPTKDSTAEFAFEFECWVTQESGTIKDDLSNVVANRSVYAKFTATKNKYTIIFVNYDGNELQSSEVEYGEMPVYSGEEPTKTRTAEYSYMFSGWSPNLVVVVADATYTASYNEVKNKYIIKFINYDGNELQSSEVEYGEMPVYVGEEPIRIGTTENSYIFCGWNPIIETVMSDATYTASFNEVKNKYTIKFVNYNGDELQVSEFEYGEMPTYTSVTPTRESTPEYSFTFIGWEPSIVAVVGDATYTASYSEVKNKYTIKFVNFDNSVLQVEELEYGDTPIYKGKTPVKPSTVDLNFTFIGWDPKIVTVTEGITYTAQFADSSQIYTITWNNYDGSVLAITDMEYGKMPIYDGVEPTKQATAQYSYSFNGWTPELVIVSGDATYTATFIEVINQYKVTFYLDDGITKIGETTVDYGADAIYEGLTPQKATTAEYTYTFNCWVSEVGGDIQDDLSNVIANRNVYASFTATKNKYIIKFVNYDNTELQSEELEYGTMPVYNGVLPSKPATPEFEYAFAGWDPEIAIVTRAVIYTAQFSDKSQIYVITWNNYDGSLLKTSYLEYGETPTYDGVEPIKDSTAQYSYAFSGWSPEIVEVVKNATYTVTFIETINQYAVTFYSEDGLTELYKSIVYYGETAIYEGMVPTKVKTAEYTYTFNCWVSEVGGDIQDDLSNVIANRNVYASFTATKNKYIIKFVNYDNTELQSEELEYGVMPIYKGEQPTKESTGTINYVFIGWDPQIMFVTDNAIYTAQYSEAKTQYTILAIAGEHGKINPTGVTTKNQGESQLYTFNPDRGYYVSVIKVDGVSLNQNQFYAAVMTGYLFEDIDSNHTIEVNFEAFKYKVVVSIKGNGLFYSEEQLIEVSHGESRLFIIETDFEKYNVKIMVNGTMYIITESQYILENIESDTYINVEFDEKSPVMEIGLIILAGGTAILSFYVVCNITIKKIKKRKY